jgi:hypothetical protein
MSVLRSKISAGSAATEADSLVPKSAVSKCIAENTGSRQVEDSFVKIADWKWSNGGLV